MSLAIAFLTLILAYLCAVIMHELGHWWYAKEHLGKDLNIHRNGFIFSVGKDYEFADVSHKQMVSLYIWGIFAGFIPLLLFAFEHSFVLLILPAYIIGCIPDIKQIIYEFKESRRKKQ